jgi:hypothetical protein
MRNARITRSIAPLRALADPYADCSLASGAGKV